MKRLLLYILILLLPEGAGAQDIYVRAEGPSVVNTGEQFTVMWSVNSGGGEFSAPSFNGFYKIMGPQTSYSSSTQIINGKMSNQTSYSYVYYLQAVKEGKFTIAPAVFIYKNKKYVSDSLRVEVVGTGGGSAGTQKRGTTSANNAVSGEDEPEVETGGSDLFVNLALSRREVYIGEPIAATLKIYSRVNLAGINEIKYPSFNNLLKNDIETAPLTSLLQENVNGTIYGTGVIQQFLLYPQTTGDITIEPVTLSLLVQQKVRGAQSDPFFGDFFSSYQTVPKAVATKPLKIKVKPLPGIKPADFSGVVGKLDISASINKESVTVNDAINFKITISGSGNLKIASAPVLKLSPDVEVYDPKVTDDLRNSINGTNGSRTFEFLLIPRHYGDYKIPPVSYSFFNNATGRYEKLETKEFRFTALKGNEQNTSVTVYGGVSKEDVKYLGKDIRFIKGDPGSFSKAGDVLVKKQTYFSLFVLAILAFAAVLFVRREHIRRNSDVTAVKNRKAGKVAIKRLHNASLCLNNGEMDQFHDEILKALWGYLSDKLSIPVSELTRTNAVTALEQKGVDSDTISSLTKILDTCEFARFAPASTGTEATSLFESASQFIKTVENTIS